MPGLILCVLVACAAPPPRYSGTVQTESIAVGSQVGGRVVAVNVAAGSRVRRGEVLLRLDPAMLAAEYAQAQAQTQQAQERLSELRNGNIPSDVARASAQSVQAAEQYRQTVAQVDPQTSAQAAAVRDARAALVLAKATFERTQRLAATGDESHQALDDARAQYAQARAKLAQARANYAALVGATLPGERLAAQANAAAQSANYQTVRSGTRVEQIEQARAELAAAKAAADYARTRLAEATIYAPADGIVQSFDLHPGDLLNPNQQAAIVDTFANPYVYIYASQRDLGTLAARARVKVLSDADGRTYDGRVETHDRTAQFTPQNVETADQRADLVYGVKIRINDPGRRLLDGTTVTVSPP